MRKNILKFDNVLNDQRKVIFEQRKIIMSADDVSDEIADYRAEVIDELVHRHIPPKAYAEQWDAKGLHDEIEKIFDIDLPVVDWTHEEGIADEEVRERLTKAVETRAAERVANFGPEIMRYAEKRSCCRRWTTIGASTSSTSIICASMSACAATASAIR